VPSSHMPQVVARARAPGMANAPSDSRPPKTTTRPTRRPPHRAPPGHGHPQRPHPKSKRTRSTERISRSLTVRWRA
jgi:hypothetical protein